MSIRWWRSADEMAADFGRRFPARPDSEFLAECGVSGDSNGERAAVAVRRSVARYGAVASDHIYGSHSYPDDLRSLSGWDSLDFIGWVLELEQELGVKVESRWFDSLPRQFSVHDLIIAVHNQLACQAQQPPESNCPTTLY